MRYTHYDEHKKRWQINDDYGAVMIDELNYAVGEAVDKLAVYEDTGLTPETCKDIKSLCDDYVDAGLDASFILACIAAARAGISSKRMAEISKAETDNRLIILPCKVGDTLYAPTRRIVSEFVITKFEYEGIDSYGHGLWVSWHLANGITGDLRLDGIDARYIGKRVFLTRAEAEAALKGMKGEREDV